MVLTYFEPAGIPFLLVLGILFYWLFLIKDLLLIDRKGAFELLLIALDFFLIRLFYANAGGLGVSGWSTWYALWMAALLALLAHSFVLNFSEVSEGRGLRRASSWLIFFLMWQFLVIGLFLPLDFVYQSVLIFLVSVLLLDTLPEHVANPRGVSVNRLMVTGITLGVLFILVIGSARWTY